MFWYTHTWHMLDDTMLLVLLDYHNNWYLFDTWLWYLVHDGDIS
jgi:hypothetical protein